MFRGAEREKIVNGHRDVMTFGNRSTRTAGPERADSDGGTQFGSILRDGAVRVEHYQVSSGPP